MPRRLIRRNRPRREHESTCAVAAISSSQDRPTSSSGSPPQQPSGRDVRSGASRNRGHRRRRSTGSESPPVRPSRPAGSTRFGAARQVMAQVRPLRTIAPSPPRSDASRRSHAELRRRPFVCHTRPDPRRLLHRDLGLPLDHEPELHDFLGRAGEPDRADDLVVDQSGMVTPGSVPTRSRTSCLSARSCAGCGPPQPKPRGIDRPATRRRCQRRFPTSVISTLCPITSVISLAICCARA